MGIKKPASGAGAWVSGAKLNSGVSASLDTRIVLPANGTWFSSFDYTEVLAYEFAQRKYYFRNVWFWPKDPRSSGDLHHAAQLHRKRLCRGSDLLLDAEGDFAQRCLHERDAVPQAIFKSPIVCCLSESVDLRWRIHSASLPILQPQRSPFRLFHSNTRHHR